MSVSAQSFHRERRSSDRPLWREAFVGLEWLALRSSPVFYGLGVPEGDKSAVIVVPGFMGTDHYLYELYSWLRHVNYKPYMSRIGWNAECLDILVDRLSETIKTAYAETGGRVHLIGHSLGGILSRSAAAQNPELVASVITLGSPFRGICSHPLVLATADRVRDYIMSQPGRRESQPDCYTGHCSCQAVCALQFSFPASIHQTAIYTKTDGVVDWRVCVNEDPNTNFEVTGTHVGLVFNPSVYQLIATRLASIRT
ncbi:MAG TPA: alpha/beta fold hydrolase [Blastocatellia bacterium]|nr:alpha/beta fold hydrolase [Blastocatellia bacterium]